VVKTAKAQSLPQNAPILTEVFGPMWLARELALVSFLKNRIALEIGAGQTSEAFIDLAANPSHAQTARPEVKLLKYPLKAGK
jgi:hypothetical protein